MLSEDQNCSADLGICQWFHYQDYEAVSRSVDLLRMLGVKHLRTGISWADFHRPDGEAWYRWQMEQLVEFDVLLSIWHTPPSLAEGGECSGPPKRLKDYADFIAQVIDLYGDTFSHLELWNEPNNRYKWNFPERDPDWSKFAEMVREAARSASELGKPTVLGGMIPVDPAWLSAMGEKGVLDYVDVVAIHGFPQMWWPDRPNWDWYEHWEGWPQKIESLTEAARGCPIWITETGLATWDLYAEREDRFRLQIDCLREAAAAPVDRVYWYCLVDLDPARSAIEGFHVDENEYHLGLVRYDGERKPAWEVAERMLAREGGS